MYIMTDENHTSEQYWGYNTEFTEYRTEIELYLFNMIS